MSCHAKHTALVPHISTYPSLLHGRNELIQQYKRTEEHREMEAWNVLMINICTFSYH